YKNATVDLIFLFRCRSLERSRSPLRCTIGSQPHRKGTFDTHDVLVARADADSAAHPGRRRSTLLDSSSAAPDRMALAFPRTAPHAGQPRCGKYLAYTSIR